MWSTLDTDHDFAQFVAFGPDVVHEHLIGSELVLDGQGVVLALLHLLQLDSFTQVPHHLNPESSLTEQAKGSVTKRGSSKYHDPANMNLFGQQRSSILWPLCAHTIRSFHQGEQYPLQHGSWGFVNRCLFRVWHAFIVISLCEHVVMKNLRCETIRAYDSPSLL